MDDCVLMGKQRIELKSINVIITVSTTVGWKMLIEVQLASNRIEGYTVQGSKIFCMLLQPIILTPMQASKKRFRRNSEKQSKTEEKRHLKRKEKKKLKRTAF